MNADASLTDTAKTKNMSKKNPLVFLDVSIDGDPLERMLFEVYDIPWVGSFCFLRVIGARFCCLPLVDVFGLAAFL